MLLQDISIDYDLLNKAILYYQALKYTQIETPWIVSADASLTTAPSEDHCFITTRNEHFVGSAEQGFIHLMKYNPEKIVPDKMYFSVSPCFRRDIPDETHSQGFIKLELFYHAKNANTLDIEWEFIRDAKRLFEFLSIKKIETIINEKSQSIDLEYNGLELGSYGSRRLNDGSLWVFGTGIALPRFQLIMKPE